jgi:hypothetical protein
MFLVVPPKDGLVHGLVNGVDDIFKASTTYCEKTIIWIMFKNSKIGTLTRENIVIITTTLNQNGH